MWLSGGSPLFFEISHKIKDFSFFVRDKQGIARDGEDFDATSLKARLRVHKSGHRVAVKAADQDSFVR